MKPRHGDWHFSIPRGGAFLWGPATPWESENPGEQKDQKPQFQSSESLQRTAQPFIKSNSLPGKGAYDKNVETQQYEMNTWIENISAPFWQHHCETIIFIVL